MGEVSRYLVTVMPSDESGAPDPGRALAFVLPGSLGVVYHPGTWHAGIAVLDAEASFAVLMWRGAEDDDVFTSIAPLEVQRHG
jgi:ureidoglycolate lyase